MARWTPRRAGAARVGALAIMLAAGTARATWSIVIVDTRTREVAVGSATCLTAFDLQANTPVVLIGVGGATAQSAVDSDGTNRTFIRDQLFAGIPPAEILAGLSAIDTSHQSRQYGIVDAAGRAATFSGTQDGVWAGGRTGRVGDLVYAVQGNVLTGQPVVDAAVEAIETTSGDLAERLMAAMEAARSFGGDGRCSCTTGQPNSCGAPPANFTKSAHIAYMIVARIGDRESGNGTYRLLGSGNPMTVADLTGDGLPECITSSNAGVGVMANASAAGGPVIFAPFSTTPNAGVLRALAPIEFNADGALDVVATDLNNDRVLVLGGTNGLGLQPITPFATGDGPTLMATGDFNADGRPDVAAFNSLAGTISILLNSGAGFAAPLTVPAPAGLSQMQSADMDKDGDTDLVVASSSLKQIMVLRCDGAGGFVTEAPFTFQAAPSRLVLADVNGDGLSDIVFTLLSESQIRILRQNGQGGFTALAFSTGSAPSGVAVADFEADGLQDLAFVSTSAGKSRLALMRGQEDGTFATRVLYQTGFGGSNILVSDMNADGLPDVIIPQDNGQMTVMTNTGGTFNPSSGLAGGSYFLEFNIAGQTANAVDPVFQLRDQFDQWAAALAGVPDALTTTAEFDPAVVWANGASVSMLTVRARDRWDVPVALSPADVSVESLSYAPTGTVGLPEAGPDGSVLVPITAGTAWTSEQFRVRITAGARTVTLMPDPALTYTCVADVNRDLFVSGDDFDLFMALFIVGDMAGDVDGNGFMNGDDFDAFTAQFEAGC